MRTRLLRLGVPCLALGLTSILAACGDDGDDSPDVVDMDTTDAPDSEGSADIGEDVTPDVEADVGEDAPLVDAPTDTPDDADADVDVAVDAAMDVDVTPPPPRAGTDESRARAFQLYYRERVDRMLVVYNRFGLLGDLDWGIALRGSWIARDGDDFELVSTPSDNNLIGTPMRSVLHAWKNLGSDHAELTLHRMLRGLVVFEQITGHPGLTSRNALPGWTLYVDGMDGEWERTRDGNPIESPFPADEALRDAVLDAFFDDITVTYRLNPRDTMLTFMPAVDPEDYAITHSIPNLPDFIRNSDCCSTLFRTPEGYDWEDAWWGNHNSRDNYPDLALGLLTALEVEAAPEGLDEDLVAIAAEVTAAGLRIADLVEDNEGFVMTVDEYNPYDTLVQSGAIRPHGLPENEGLGGMSSCPMALLNRSLSSEGLESEPVDLWIPGTPELLITPDIELLLDCPYETPRACATIDDAWCGHTWESIFDLQLLGQNWLDFARNLEANDPGSAGDILGAFQNDYDDVVEAMVTLIGVLEVQGEWELAYEARVTLGHMTDLMREFADIVYGNVDPNKQAEQRYAAALFDAMGRREPIAEDFGDFAIEEAWNQRIEDFIDIGDTSPRDLYTDEELLQIITDGLANLEDKSGPGRSDAIRARYAATYPDGNPPIRRAGDAYEARQGDGEWFPVERPHHRGGPNFHVLEGIVLCSIAPDVLDCSWARLGCEAPDLDASGSVDADDTALLEAAFTTHGEGATCTDGCDGADVDASGTLDASDRAFMEAAQGCFYDVGE